MPQTIKSDSNKQWVIKTSKDIWTLAEKATLHVYNAAAVYVTDKAAGNTINIQGDILNTGSEMSSPDPDIFPCGIAVFGKNTTINFGEKSHVVGLAAVYGMGTGLEVNNKGDIEGGIYGIIAGAGGRINNSGEITGMYGVGLGGKSTFVNLEDGFVFGGGMGVGSMDNANHTIINKGFLGGVTAIMDADGDSRTINTGTIEGNVALGAGNDLFDTSAGVFRGTVVGGDGNDTYVTSGKLKIMENASEGFDVVKSSATFTLAANVEKLVLLGKANLDGNGSADANGLYGNAGNNKLDGKAGVDLLDGGKGDDMLIGGTEGDHFVFRPGYGIDTVKDYVDGTDKIAILGFGEKINDFSELTIKDKGDDTWIIFGKDDRLVLEGVVDSTTIDATDFLYALV